MKMAELMKVTEVAEALRLSVRQVWKMASAGRLPAPLKVGGSRSVRWRASDLALFVDCDCDVKKYEAATAQGKVRSV